MAHVRYRTYAHVVLADLDGYELVFSEEPVDADASFDEVVGTTDRSEPTRRKPGPS